MQKENKTIKSCHSRELLSVIYNACRYTRKPQTMCVEDPRLQASGMMTLLNNTSSSVPTGQLSPHGEATHFNAPSTWRERVAGGRVRGKISRGFTLIELLVVVLIIGILAAVALPQYQKAVERSKATQALSVLSSLSQAYQAYYLEHGTYATKLDDLPLTVPWTGKTRFLSFATDTKSNDDWALEIENSFGYVILRISRISGKYKGAGFSVGYENPTNTAKKTILCIERTANSNFIFDEFLGAGAYCVNLIHGKFIDNDKWSRWYSLP